MKIERLNVRAQELFCESSDSDWSRHEIGSDSVIDADGAFRLGIDTDSRTGGAATSVDDEIKRLEETRNQAVLHGDVDALDRMTSPPYWMLDVEMGIYSYYFAEICRHVTGVDSSRNMLSENPCSNVVQSDAGDLPFQTESFDVLFEANVLHHVEDRSRVVREMARVSRRWVILIEPNRYNPLMLAFGVVVPAERGLLTSTRQSNLALLREAGLKPVSWMTTGMISQNNTPQLLLPILRRFDREIWYGEYIILIAEKQSQKDIPAPQELMHLQA